MSAPVSHHPLVVNTADGACWTRRAVTPVGSGLYALAGSVAGVPDEVLVSLADLAELGITGSAFALPVPVGPVDAGPVVRLLELHEAQVDALAAAGNRVVNDAVHEHLCMCSAWPEKCVSTGNYFMGAWDVDGLEAALPAVLGLWERMRGGELERLRARVAELEAERHSTNEALSDAAEALRANRDRIVELEALLRLRSTQRGDVARLIEVAGGLGEECVDVDELKSAISLSADEPADKLTALFAPTQVLREEPVAEAVTPRVQAMRALLDGQRAAVEDPHDSPLHHSYRVPRDRPDRECAFKNPHEPHTNEPRTTSEWQCPGVPRPTETGGA